MLLTYIFFIAAVASNTVHGYDMNTDLARGLVHKNLTIVASPPINGRTFSDYPEDCAAIYLNAKMFNQHISSGIYEIWPREGL